MHAGGAASCADSVGFGRAALSDRARRHLGGHRRRSWHHRHCRGEFARRYGWKLHLLGKSPAPAVDAAWRNYSPAEMQSLKTSIARQAVAEGRSVSEAWDRVLKDVEIFANLQAFREAGVTATYHACDVSDRAALAAVLNEVRRQDGPIRGILHGAGTIDPARFESKRRGVVESLIGAKFDGTLNLMALTREDPLGWFIGFGSISGRFGGNGLSDYAAGNDVLAKAIDYFRAAGPTAARRAFIGSRGKARAWPRSRAMPGARSASWI